ncbi:MAG: Holliday junction branch migration protein RuvA [Polyangiales bacterium]
MIGWLKGRLVDSTESGVILDVGGVGYELQIPHGALGKATRHGEELEIFVHTHVRDDAISLFGFATNDDRSAFRALLGVTSIGPKLAMAIVGRLEFNALCRAIATQDKNAFKGISGVGKKTIERIFIDLKDKLPAWGGPAVPPPHASLEPNQQVAVKALVQMGYKPKEAEAAVAQVYNESTAQDLTETIRSALSALS